MANEEKEDIIHISGKAIVVIIILLLLLSGTLGMFAFKNSSHNENSKPVNNQIDNSYDNLPEKCRPPTGEDITSWKEHLSHHIETQDCLKYFK